jgi:low temperature requirement protein LtrA
VPPHSQLREHGEKADHRVSAMELFFDLVFVFAVTQLSHYLLEHHTALGALQTTVMFLAMWWAWIYTAWATNWLDPGRTQIRLLLIAVMLLSLVLSSAIPGAFGAYGIHFALAYVAIQIGRTAYTSWAKGEWEPGASKNMTRATIYFLAAAPLWIIGGLDSDPQRRLAWWFAALVVEYAGPQLFFFVPGLGRSTLEEWDISGAHMAERCALFIIISLGEGILVTGATFADLQPSLRAVLDFLSAFLGTVAMWWIYFDVGARRGSELIEHEQHAGLI